jgi:hypothetical protein
VFKGVESRIDLPTDRWTLLSFVFRNHSSASSPFDADGTSYSLQYFVNGALDVSVSVKEAVLPVRGDAGLVLFKDPAHAGELCNDFNFSDCAF